MSDEFDRALEHAVATFATAMLDATRQDEAAKAFLAAMRAHIGRPFAQAFEPTALVEVNRVVLRRFTDRLSDRLLSRLPEAFADAVDHQITDLACRATNLFGSRLS